MATSGPATAATPLSNYARFMQADFNQPGHYPIAQSLDPALYRPAAAWLGRLILPAPAERATARGVLFEVYEADAEHRGLVGRVVRLRWTDDALANQRFWSVTRTVRFDDDSRKAAAKGTLLPERIDNWLLVNPFESMAASLPTDRVIVRLEGPVQVEEDADGPILTTPREPVQITGRAYALARFLGPAGPAGEEYRIAHFSRASGAFDGPEEVVLLPAVMPTLDDVRPAVAEGIERSPTNDDGWYLYGAQDADGRFVVQALMPRGLVRLRPQVTLVGRRAAADYLKRGAWKGAAAKGTITTTLLAPDGSRPEESLAAWKEGDAALLIHLYGAIGGRKAESAAKSPLYWGHFAFGVARVVREPLADELIFDIVYHQIYLNNGDGIISGAQHWSRYVGDRQFGWLGTRPIQDVLIKLDCFTEDFDFGTLRRSALTETAYALETMAARYRIADGRGGASISAANNCSQDSNQALYAAVKRIDATMRGRDDLAAWRAGDPAGAARLEELLVLGRDLRRKMLPLGAARADWEWGAATLGSSQSESPLRSLGLAVRSWRAMLPSVAVRAIAGVFLDHGATAWVLRTHQVGGDDPEIAPYLPNV